MAMPRKGAIEPPRREMMLLEARAVFEFGSLLPATPLLRRATKGDGHPVLVLPPLFGSDLSTLVLRRFLSPNPQPEAAVADRLAQAEENWKPFEPPTRLPWSIAPRLGLRKAAAHE